MSLLQVDLPSEDEADDDYDPTKDDKTDDKAPVKGKQNGTKRRRGSATYQEASVDTSAGDAETAGNADGHTPAELAKRSKIDQLWAQLNTGKNPQPTATAAKQHSEAAALDTAAPTTGAQKQFSLTAFCRPVPKTQNAGSDAVS